MKHVMKCIKGDKKVPKSSEHNLKFLENKEIIETVLNEKEKNHCNWVSTICFYAALHRIEMELALDNVHSKDHKDREQNMCASGRITRYILVRFKQMYTTSIMARYEAKSVSPAIANQMRNYLKQIEKEFLERKVS